MMSLRYPMGHAADRSLLVNDLALTPAAFANLSALIGQAVVEYLQAFGVFVSGGYSRPARRWICVKDRYTPR